MEHNSNGMKDHSSSPILWIAIGGMSYPAFFVFGELLPVGDFIQCVQRYV
jgi:hypothetical protein